MKLFWRVSEPADVIKVISFSDGSEKSYPIK
jgi:hypothetical protein